jgi:cytidylate kinase
MTQPVVTVAAFYGAGGTVVAPQVAQRLNVSFLDRGVLVGVAARMGIPESAAAGYEEQQGPVARYFERLSRGSGPDASPMDRLDIEEQRYRAETEAFLASATKAGGVVLGRAGAVVLGSVPGALHVLLGGPREARIKQAMTLDNVDRETAERRQRVNDQERMGWLSRVYGVDPVDPDLYHLRIDSTALPLDACVELILAASQARLRDIPSAR